MALYPSASSSCHVGQSKQSKDSFFLNYLDPEYRCGMWLLDAGTCLTTHTAPYCKALDVNQHQSDKPKRHRMHSVPTLRISYDTQSKYVQILGMLGHKWYYTFPVPSKQLISSTFCSSLLIFFLWLPLFLFSFFLKPLIRVLPIFHSLYITLWSNDETEHKYVVHTKRNTQTLTGNFCKVLCI